MSDWTFNGVARMLEMISSQSLTALFQVVMIDLVLAGDNAIVIGLAAAGLPDEQRRKAIIVGLRRVGVAQSQDRWTTLL